MGSLQCRKIISAVDNCSAHTIDEISFSNISPVFLPPSITSCLQPVDASIGRSFKCTFRRILFLHTVRYVDKQMEIPSTTRPPFKINSAVSTYDAVCMMAQLWNMAPTSVVLNG